MCFYLISEGFFMRTSNGFGNLFLTSMIAVTILLSIGCESTQKAPPPQPSLVNTEAVSLYVDAMMLNDINDRDKAIKKLSAAIELSPEFAMAHSLKGDIYQTDKQYDQSADSYEAATHIDPWSFKDFFNLGKMSHIIEQFARAVKAYVSAADLEPEHYGSHIGAAKCYYELEDYDQAFQYSTRAKVLDPSMADPDMVIGDIYEAQQQHEEAIDAYRRALEIEGNNPKTMVSLAIAYLRTERFDAAEELLNSAIQIDPQNSVAYQYLGFTQLKLRKPNLAIESYKKAVQLDPNDWMAHKGIGVVYILQSVQNEQPELKTLGVEHWKTSLQINPDQPKLKLLLERYTTQ